MKKGTIVLTVLISAALIIVSGCAKNSSSNAAVNQKSGSAAVSSASSGAVIALYNKVELKQAKADIDKSVAITPTANSDAANTYDYIDSKTGFGVSVLYDKDNKATAKTLMYNSHKDIASLCKKSVNKQQADKIKNKSTYDQVKELLGGDGVEVCRTIITFDDNKESKIYRWANSDGSCIQVSFGTDGTVSNAMFGSNNY